MIDRDRVYLFYCCCIVSLSLMYVYIVSTRRMRLIASMIVWSMTRSVGLIAAGGGAQRESETEHTDYILCIYTVTHTYVWCGARVET